MYLAIAVIFLVISPLCESRPPIRTERDAEEAFLTDEYHNFKQLKVLFRKLEQKHRNLAKVRSIGKSVKGKDILLMEIHGNINNIPPLTPRFKYVANVYGNHAVGRELVIYLAEYLLTKYGKDDRITKLVNTTDIFLIPSLNPDGFEHSDEGDCNRYHYVYNQNNVNLNTNFPDQVKGTQDANLIQPETEAMMKFIQHNHFVLSGNLQGDGVGFDYPIVRAQADSCREGGPTSDSFIFMDLSQTYSSKYDMLMTRHNDACSEARPGKEEDEGGDDDADDDTDEDEPDDDKGSDDDHESEVENDDDSENEDEDIAHDEKEHAPDAEGKDKAEDDEEGDKSEGGEEDKHVDEGGEEGKHVDEGGEEDKHVDEGGEEGKHVDEGGEGGKREGEGDKQEDKEPGTADDNTDEDNISKGEKEDKPEGDQGDKGESEGNAVESEGEEEEEGEESEDEDRQEDESEEEEGGEHEEGEEEEEEEGEEEEEEEDGRRRKARSADGAGMAEFNYFGYGCFEVTFWLSCCPYPEADKLRAQWKENKEALISFIESAHWGIKGMVMNDAAEPVPNAMVVIDGNEHHMTTTAKGEYWRLLLPGSYKISVKANGYQTTKTETVVVVEGQTTIRSFVLTARKRSMGGASHIIKTAEKLIREALQNDGVYEDPSHIYICMSFVLVALVTHLYS